MPEENKEKKQKKGWFLKARTRCRTIYWQNFLLTASVVMLTLALLGSAFFALTYSYAIDERSEEMQSKASVVSHMVSSYMESGSLTGLRELADFASSVTDAQFLICNADGNLLLTTDPSLANRVLTVPKDVSEGAMSSEPYAVRTTLGSIYADTHFVVGVPIESGGATVGFVLAVTGARALTTMWRTFIGLFFMTAVTVLLLSFVVSAWVSMRQSHPIHEMAEATRRFADGNFDVRMHNYAGVTEITELADAFNNMADSLQETERQRREVIAEEEALQAERNKLSKEIGALMGQGKTDEANATKETVRQINEKLTALGDARAEAEAAMDALMLSIPNMVDATTPVGEDENDNPEVRRWGTPRDFAAEGFEPQAHWDLGPALNIIDFERGVKLAESRFYVLGGAGARLERALIAFMLDQHTSRGYKEWWVPALANAATLTGTGQLPKFEEDLFHTTEGLYLIPTAEVQLTNLHAGEVLDADSLPLHYCAFTPCFREEAGSAGRDTRGIIRVHQFSKVEMVKFATPETGFDELESMVEDAENILQQLKLPYRVISLCTGDIGFSSAKTYDVEVWLPSYGAYKEISSCSCCTDFQARRANIKYRDPENFKGSRYVHTLNGSGLAVGRTMAAVIENYQQPDGTVRVPDVLVPYMGGVEVIAPE